MVRYTVCFYCNGEYAGPAKVSTRDNTTKICSQCAEFEALRELIIKNLQQPTGAAFESFYQLLSIRLGPLRS
jgi:hypothetical protein